MNACVDLQLQLHHQLNHYSLGVRYIVQRYRPGRRRILSYITIPRPRIWRQYWPGFLPRVRLQHRDECCWFNRLHCQQLWRNIGDYVPGCSRVIRKPLTPPSHRTQVVIYYAVAPVSLCYGGAGILHGSLPRRIGHIFSGFKSLTCHTLGSHLFNPNFVAAGQSFSECSHRSRLYRPIDGDIEE